MCSTCDPCTKKRRGKPLDYVIPWPGKKEREIHEYHVIVCGHLQAFYEACRPALGDDLTDVSSGIDGFVGGWVGGLGRVWLTLESLESGYAFMFEERYTRRTDEP